MTISYELALKLKNAGFPQFKRKDGKDIYMGEWLTEDGKPYTYGSEPVAKDIILAELIEACGEEEYIFMEHRNISGSRDWLVRMTTLNRGIYHGVGETLSIAVAMLWLALHPKKL